MIAYRYFKKSDFSHYPLLDIESIFYNLTHSLLKNQDIDSALNMLKRKGIRSHDGIPVLLGIDELIQELKEIKQDFQRYFSMEEALQEFKEKVKDLIPEKSYKTVQELMEKLSRELRNLSDETATLSGTKKELIQDRFKIFAFGRMIQKYSFTGKKKLSWKEAIELAKTFDQIAKLERDLKKVTWGFDPKIIDVSEIQKILGDLASYSWLMINRLHNLLEDEGYIKNNGHRYFLTSKALKKMGNAILNEIFSKLKRDRWGAHPTCYSGNGITMSGETKPYHFGDTFSPDINKTLMNSLMRNGERIPIKIFPEDFEIYQTENSTSSSTVLLLDMSKSMKEHNNFTSAKMVTLALESLIRLKYPRDNITIIGFSSWARPISIEDVPYLQWDNENPYTNMEEGLSLAGKHLLKQKGKNKQIILISDGEPTAHKENGYLFFQFPPHPYTLQKTLQMAKYCGSKGITINSFLLGTKKNMAEFIKELARINRGRIFFTDSTNLGSYVLLDYLNHKRPQTSSISCL